MKKYIYFLLGIFFVTFTSCRTVSSSGRAFSPENLLGQEILWPVAALSKPVVIQTIQTTSEASYHLVRLKGAEAPHVHETHDLAVCLLKGKALVHLGDQVIKMKPGDFLTIPRGMPHWGENKSRKPAEALVVFTPPFDGTDQRPVS